MTVRTDVVLQEDRVEVFSSNLPQTFFIAIRSIRPGHVSFDLSPWRVGSFCQVTLNCGNPCVYFLLPQIIVNALKEKGVNMPLEGTIVSLPDPRTGRLGMMVFGR